MTRMTRVLLAAGLSAAVTPATPAFLEAQRSGVEIWSQTCGRCHLPQPAIRYTADQWESIMMDMAIFARLTDADAVAVLEFLKGGAKKVALAAPPGPDRRPPILLASTGGVQLPPPTDGAVLYGQYCSACHGKSGQGDGPAAAALAPRPTNLADSAFQASRTDTQLAEVIANGKGTMPGFATRLGEDGVKALVTHIRALATRHATGK